MHFGSIPSVVEFVIFIVCKAVFANHSVDGEGVSSFQASVDRCLSRYQVLRCSSDKTAYDERDEEYISRKKTFHWNGIISFTSANILIFNHPTKL